MGRRDAKRYVYDHETGKYDYVGKVYAVMADEKDFKRLQVGGFLISLALLALFVICGLFTFGGMNCNYVMGPYVLLIVPTAWMFYQCWKLLRKTDELTESGNRIMMHLHWTSLAAAVLGLAAAIGQIVFCVLHGMHSGDIAFIVLMLLCIPLGVTLFVLVRKCPTEVLTRKDSDFELADD